MLFQAEEETLISHLHKEHFSSMELETSMSVHKATVIGESAVNIVLHWISSNYTYNTAFPFRQWVCTVAQECYKVLSQVLALFSTKDILILIEERF